MSTLFSARRKPKRIAREEPENQADDGEEDSGPVVRRPNLNAPRNKSKLRVSFNPGEEDGSGIVEWTPRESAVSRTTKPSSKLGLSSTAQDIISRREQEDRERDTEGQNHDRPKYNKAYLDELRNSTPSTPRDLSSSRDSPSLELVQPSPNLELDLESKFGKSALPTAGPSSSRIPSAAEIKEKKDRRARLAKEQQANAYTDTNSSAGADFIPLEDYDSDGEFKPRRMQVGSYLAPAKEKDTRLIHEDEDIAEGFDDFVEDAGRITLSRKGLREQSRREKEDLRNMIDAAEGSGGSNENSDAESASDSDLERRREYELAQTHHGMDGLSSHSHTTRRLTRPRQPRETTPVPKLSAGLTRLREMVSALEFEKAKIVKRKADIDREKGEIKASQEHIQRSLEEAGEELERVRRKHAERIDANGSTGTATAGTNGHALDFAGTERGLESFGDHA